MKRDDITSSNGEKTFELPLQSEGYEYTPIASIRATSSGMPANGYTINCMTSSISGINNVVVRTFDRNGNPIQAKFNLLIVISKIK